MNVKDIGKWEKSSESNGMASEKVSSTALLCLFSSRGVYLAIELHCHVYIHRRGLEEKCSLCMKGYVI